MCSEWLSILGVILLIFGGSALIVDYIWIHMTASGAESKSDQNGAEIYLLRKRINALEEKKGKK